MATPAITIAPQAKKSTSASNTSHTMMIMLGALTTFFAFIGQPAFASPMHEVLAKYPNGTYLENLLVNRDGAVLYTNYFSKTIEQWSKGRATTFATLEGYPVNLVELPDGYLVLVHGRKFTEGSDALRENNRLLKLDKTGKVKKSIALPGVVFGNGLALLSSTQLLMTDSILGRIWLMNPATGSVTSWFENDQLKPAPNQQAPGANGLRRAGNKLYVSNSSARKLFLLSMSNKGTAVGGLTEIDADFPGIDDFAIGANNTLFIATHQASVIRFQPGKPLAVILDKDVEGCTSTALSRDGKSLYVLGTGGLYEGKKDEATLVRVNLKR